MARFIDTLAVVDGVLLVDGEEFPWHVGPEVVVRPNSVTVTLIAENVMGDIRFEAPAQTPAQLEAAREALRRRARGA